MDAQVDEVLQAISRNVTTVSRQLSQENPDKNQLLATLRSSVVNLDRISHDLSERESSDIRDSLEALIDAVNGQPSSQGIQTQEVGEQSEGAHNSTPRVRPRAKGRPTKIVDVNEVKSGLAKGYTAKAIAKHLECSASLVYKILHKEGLSVRSKYQPLSEDQLDSHIREIHESHPKAGNEMVNGYLKARGVIVQRRRVRESLTRVDPPAAAVRWSSAISRRTYKVPVPNSLWHMDGHMRLIRWGLVTHGCIDGFSRLITFLRCGPNNRASTVLNLFIEAVMKYGLPSRVRSDHGGENFQVALFMNLIRDERLSNHITGRSVHNQRIERLWRDVHQQVADNFYSKFYEMEDRQILDPSNDIHICAIQLVYIPEINRMLEEFQKGWNCHRMRTEGNRSPEQMWIDGMLEGEATHCSVRELHQPKDIHGNLEAKLQSFGLSAEDMSLAEQDIEEPRVTLRNGHQLSTDLKAELERETGNIQCLEEKYLHYVQKISNSLDTLHGTGLRQ